MKDGLEFWAHSCTHSYGTSKTDYSIEGNVAFALQNLKRLCGLTDKKMVDVLKSKENTQL